MTQEQNRDELVKHIDALLLHTGAMLDDVRRLEELKAEGEAFERERMDAATFAASRGEALVFDMAHIQQNHASKRAYELDLTDHATEGAKAWTAALLAANRLQLPYAIDGTPPDQWKRALTERLRDLWAAFGEKVVNDGLYGGHRDPAKVERPWSRAKDDLDDRRKALTRVQWPEARAPEKKPKVQKVWLLAHQNYEFAINHPSAPEKKTVEAVHRWLKENGDPEYDLPDLATFKSYLGRYRRAVSGATNAARRGRAGRSVVRQDEI